MTLAALGTAARFINGAAFKPTDWEKDGFPIIRIQNLTGTGDNFNYTTRAVKPELHVDPGDLLVSWSATLDVYKWNGPRGVLNQHIFKVIPNKGVDPDYLYYALKSALLELQSKTHGSTMKHVVRGDFEGTQIYLPALSEQRHIVDLLSRADGIVRLRREAQKKAQQLTPALFLDMFGDPQSNTQKHQVVPLNTLCHKIVDGTHKTPAYVSSGIPFVTVKNIVTGQIDLSDTKFISEREHLELIKRANPEPGDILVSKDGTIGLPCLVQTDRVFSIFVSVALLKVRHDLVDSAFLASQFKTGGVQKQIRDGTRGVAIRHLHLRDFKTLQMILPPLPLQREFRHRVTEIRALEGQQDAALVKAEATFNSLLARMFSADSTSGAVAPKKRLRTLEAA